MDGILITWSQLLIAVVLATAIYLLEVVLFSRRRKPADKSNAIKDLNLDLDAMHARLSELERQMRDLRGDLREVMDSHAKAAKEREELQSTPYAQAVQLARQGVNPQDLAQRCGITNGEAELIVALNRAEP